MSQTWKIRDQMPDGSWGPEREVTLEQYKAEMAAASKRATAALINAAAAMPKTHAVVTLYADGSTRRHETRSLATAENWATGERRKIGRTLINRATGKAVEVVGVTVEPLA